MRVRAKIATESAPFYGFGFRKITVLCRFGGWKFAAKKNVMFVKLGRENWRNSTEFMLASNSEIIHTTVDVKTYCYNNCWSAVVITGIGRTCRCYSADPQKVSSTASSM